MNFETVLSHASTALAWALSVLLVVNLLARRIPAAAVLRLETASPRAANALRLCRAIGPDLDKALRVLFALVTGRPWVVPVALAESDRPTDPPDPPKPPKPPAATPSAGLLALIVVCVLACGPHPWHVTAHAAINAQAHGLAVADAVLARAIAEDTEQSPEVLRARYESAVRSLRVSLEVLRAAEATVDGATAAQSTAEQCRAVRAVQEALGVVSRIAEVLRTAGVSVPQELSDAASSVVSIAELTTRLCLQGGAQ